MREPQKAHAASPQPQSPDTFSGPRSREDRDSLAVFLLTEASHQTRLLCVFLEGIHQNCQLKLQMSTLELWENVHLQNHATATQICTFSRQYSTFNIKAKNLFTKSSIIISVNHSLIKTMQGFVCLLVDECCWDCVQPKINTYRHYPGLKKVHQLCALCSKNENITSIRKYQVPINI